MNKSRRWTTFTPPRTGAHATLHGLFLLRRSHPSPVYQNRLAGGILDVWNRPYNNTIVGDPDDLKPGQHFDYPPFKGFYPAVRWVELNTTQGPITAIVDQDPASPTYVQIFTPQQPPPALAGRTLVPFPAAGISFLNAIAAVGNKFAPPQAWFPRDSR